MCLSILLIILGVSGMNEIIRLQCMLDELVPQLQIVAREIVDAQAKHNRSQLRIVTVNPQTKGYNDETYES